MPRVLGIDLGTTNSCVAVLDGDNPMVVPMEDGRFTLPSVVAFLEDGRHLVGTAARRQAATNAANTIYVAKRVIGRSFADPQTQAAMQAVPYRCVEGPNGDVRIEARGRTWAIQEISALILAELRKAAETQFNETITQAVITVPAYFNDHQRQATKDAAEIAGLQVLRMINEPTAAALAHGFLYGATRRVAVYDLGGGTFDVSILKMGNGTVEVLATAGDAFLGGRDCDNRVVDWLLETIKTDHNVDLSDHPDAKQRLHEAAEGAKIALSESESATLALPFLAITPEGKPLHVELQLTRATLEVLCKDLVQRSLSLFNDTLKAADMRPDELDELVLVGGMTRMPLVRASVEGITKKAAATGVHPDLVVAVGAAVQAGMLKADAPKTKLVDVTPHNLGISTVAGLAETVIPKDTALPVEIKRMFTTARDDQVMVSIVVFQGESRKMQSNEVLGEFNLSGLRPAPRGTVNIEVTFAINEEGIVNVTARDVDTGAEQAITISGSRGLDNKERQRMAAIHKDQVANARVAKAS